MIHMQKYVYEGISTKGYAFLSCRLLGSLVTKFKI